MKNYRGYPSQQILLTPVNVSARPANTENVLKKPIFPEPNGKSDEISKRLKRIHGLVQLLIKVASEDLPESDERTNLNERTPQLIGPEINNFDFDTRVRQFEIGLIVQALIETGGKQNLAAKLLGVKKTTLNAKIKRYNIPIGELATVKMEHLLAMGGL